MEKMFKSAPEGILLVDKPVNKTSFSLVSRLRKILNVKKIGHAGTLDPLASGVMILLIGRNYTKLSDLILTQDKEYLARLQLGIQTKTFDLEGEVISSSNYTPSLEEISSVLNHFQGKITQIPPMYSAKKVNGQPLYKLARKGLLIERNPIEVDVQISLIYYEYPFLNLQISCSKGTYIRTLADDIGKKLNCFACLEQLRRIQSGPYAINQCLDGSLLYKENPDREQICMYLTI